MNNNEQNIENVCDFGILGTYPLANIGFETNNEYSNEEIDNIIKDILNQYKNNIDKINKNIFINIFNNCFYGVTGMDIWNEDYFNDIVNIDMLPSNFNELNDDEKSDILFEKEIDESDFEDIENSNLKLFNIEKIKNYNKIYNVVINEEYNSLSIEVYFLCNTANDSICLPMINMKYSDNFNIIDLDPGL